MASHFLNYDTVLETKKVYVGNGHGWVIVILGVKFMEVENFFESILGPIYQEQKSLRDQLWRGLFKKSVIKR